MVKAMINNSPETAIKNIFERAATSLSYKRDQLDKTRRILKKVVLRLSASIYSSDAKINAVLKDIKSSVDVSVDINDLDSQIDKLYVLTSHAGKHSTTTEETGFYSTLEKALSETECSKTCSKHIQSFADRKLSDKELSLEILKLLDNTAVIK